MNTVGLDARDRIAMVRVNRSEKLNAINSEMVHYLHEAFRWVREDDDLWWRCSPAPAGPSPPATIWSSGATSSAVRRGRLR